MMKDEWDYAKLSQKAAEHGGPKQFLEDYATEYYQLGKEDEKETEGIKRVLLVGLSIITWKGVVEPVYRKIKKYHEKRKKEIQKRADVIEAQLLDSMMRAEESEKRNLLTEGEYTDGTEDSGEEVGDCFQG